MSKFIFFLNSIDPHGVELKKELEANSFFCIQASTPNELIQTGTQTTKILTIIANLNIPEKLLQDSVHWEFDVSHILYLAGEPKMSAEIKAKIESLGLKIFHKGIKAELIKYINDYFDNKIQTDKKDTEDGFISELEFNTGNEGE